MTREELRDYVEEQRSLNNIPYHVYSELIDGIDTLEQEPICPSHGIDCEDCPAYDPCGDVISRQGVLDLAKKGVLISNGNYESVCKAINDLPSVNPTKTGHWIEPTSDMIHNHICGSCEVICSSCNENAIDEYKYCPNCGAKMIDPQERSE